MERTQLEEMLGRGLSVEAIAREVRRDPSTVSYWMRKHGLVASGREKHAPKGGIARERLEALVAEGHSVARLAEILRRSPTTVRHWLDRYELETVRTQARRARREAADGAHAGRSECECPIHGRTLFWRESRGYLRCLKCRQEAVVRRRRRVKEILVAEAGGGCAICGYDRYLGALQFHHLDPAAKSFSLSMLGVGRALEKAKAEARKCVLLCSNCHAEVEAGVAQPPG